MPLIRPTRAHRPQRGSFYVWVKSTEGPAQTHALNGDFILTGKDAIIRRVILTEWNGKAFLGVGIYMKAFNELGDGWHSYFTHEATREEGYYRGYYEPGELQELGYKMLGQIFGKFEKTDFHAVKKTLLYVYRRIFY